MPIMNLSRISYMWVASRLRHGALPTSEKDLAMSLHLGSLAPDFTQDSTHGRLRLHEWLGQSWGVLFSHPKDFTPVCTTELGAAARLQPEFQKRNVKIAALSVDPLESHHKWIGDIEDTQK